LLWCRFDQDSSVNDLLEDNKGLQDGIFQCMHVLTKGKAGGAMHLWHAYTNV
jgi:hypothetical protein